MAENWKDYQEEAADFFRSLGYQASTDVSLQGVRTKHDVDVVVEIDLSGFSVTWVIECKHWQRRVDKSRVMALREIVADLGADRGIILCEEGFQKGAIEAANLTNIQVSSLAEMRISSRNSIAAFRLHELFDRTAVCKQRYWDLPKDLRIEKGLRPGFGDAVNYSGDHVAAFLAKYLGLALRAAFPITLDPFDTVLLGRTLPAVLNNPDEALSVLEPVIAELEEKLDAAIL